MFARLGSAAGAAIATLLVGVLVAPAAHAGSEATIKTGTCSDGSRWKVKAKPDNGKAEVEGEVDSNVNGQTWKWKIRHNASVVASGSATTTGPSGSFSVERKVSMGAGSDTYTFRAVHHASGEVCKGSVTI